MIRRASSLVVTALCVATGCAGPSVETEPTERPATPPSTVSPSHASFRDTARECPLDHGLTTGYYTPSPVPVPASFQPQPARAIYGVRFFRNPPTYGIAPRTWHCGVLTGGVANEIELSPQIVRYAEGEPTEISVIWNYGGAGDVAGVECDWFRWAIGQELRRYDACRGEHPSRTLTITPVLDQVGVPYAVLVRTPPGSLKSSLSRLNRPYPTYDFAVLNTRRHGTARPALQGVSCTVPSRLYGLCLKNIKLFLATTGAAREISARTARRLVADMARLVADDP